MAIITSKINIIVTWSTFFFVFEVNKAAPFAITLSTNGNVKLLD